MSTDDRFAPFAAALLDPERPPPPGLVTWNRSDPAVRFAVYRNNVVAALTAALAETFPVTQAVVGQEFFSAAAVEFVRRHPPRSPLLVDHAAALPAFLTAFPPAQGLPWLGALAELELARVRAGRAADADALPGPLLAARLEEASDLATVRLGLHPSVQWFEAPWAVVSLWAAHQGRGAVSAVAIDAPEAALVLRDGDAVRVLPIPPAAGGLARLLVEGRPLGDAVADDAAAETLTEVLTLLIRHGAVVAWHASGALHR